MALTETSVKNARPAEKAYKLADGYGMFLLVNLNGSRLWRLKYRFGGKEKLLALEATRKWASNAPANIATTLAGY